MEYQTVQKNITSSPRKVRLVADMVRKMDPYRALEVLQFTKNAAAQPLMKAIKTAIANAGKKESLGFSKIEINDGPKLKRQRAGTAGRGRGRPYKKRWSHIKIVLTDDVVAFSPAQAKKAAKAGPTNELLEKAVVESELTEVEIAKAIEETTKEVKKEKGEKKG